MDQSQRQSTNDQSNQIIKTNKKEYWAEKIQQWEQSGLSQAEFCKRYSIAPSSFYSWKSRLLKNKNGKSAKPNRLIPIQASKSRSTQEVMRLMLLSGVRVELPLTIPSDKLTGILKSLGVFK